MGSSESAEYTATAIQSAGKVHATAALKHTSGHSVVTFAYCHSILLRLAKFGDAQLGSAGVSPTVAWASLRFTQGRLCPRVCWGGTPLQLRPGRPRYIKQCHPILQASVGGPVRMRLGVYWAARSRSLDAELMREASSSTTWATTPICLSAS